MKPQQLASIIYTSGTTGCPKGVRLTHDCWVYQSEAAESVNLFTERDHQFLWLPLAHSFGKVLEICAIRLGFPTTVDSRMQFLMENLARVRPTFMGAPPRIFEKIYGHLMLSVEQASGLQRRLRSWALEVARLASRSPNPPRCTRCRRPRTHPRRLRTHRDGGWRRAEPAARLRVRKRG